MPRANKNDGIFKIEDKRARLIGIAVAFVTYFLLLFIMAHVDRLRVQWLAAFFLELGGPHLLAGLVGLIAGYATAFHFQVKADEKFFKLKK